MKWHEAQCFRQYRTCLRSLESAAQHSRNVLRCLFIGKKKIIDFIIHGGRMKKRIFGTFIALLVALSLLPVSALAGEPDAEAG